MIRAQRLRSWLLGSTMLVLAGATPALAQSPPALPSGGAFVSGQGTITPSSPSLLTIDQASTRGVINWNDFSIGDAGKVVINNANGATLNRVLGGQISRIDGLLSASGSVYLINPQGVIIGAGGRILSGGNAVVSTRPVDPEDFMAGGPLRAKGTSSGDIVNGGQILSQGGGVVLIARNVTNTGTIGAANGRVSLAAGDDVLMATTDGRANDIFVSVAGEGGDVTQSGRIEAAAVALKAAHGNVFALAGNRDGLVQATGTRTINGELWLAAPNGTVAVAGTLAAKTAGGDGGKVVLTGANVQVASTARVTATGAQSGEVLVGASGFGTGADLAASTTVASGATILAGGPSGGGRIETSGKALSLGAATISAGQGGAWLVDPDDLTIDAPAASTITTALNAGTNVTQATTAGGAGGNGDITVAAPVTWTGVGNLTLDAYRNLSVNQPISGGGAVTLTAGGTLSLGATGQVSGTNLTLTGASFVNGAGANALTATGRWLVYSGDPAADSPGGLTPDFYQYAAPAGATPATTGNGLLYTIAPTVTVALGAVTKSYDGTTVATLDDANTTVGGLINGDAWTLDGAYGTKDAGTGLTVTASNFAATHNGVGVYGYTVGAIASVTTGQITRAVLTASIVGTPTKVYNGTTAANLTSANYALTGVAAGETITADSAATVAYDSKNAGPRVVNATFSTPNFTAGGGTSLTNYVLPTTATGAGLINQAPIQINSVTAANKVYDGDTTAVLNVAGAEIFGVIGGEDVTLNTAGATGTFATRNAVANQVVTASGLVLNGADAANYTILQPAGLTASITPAPVSIANVLIVDKVYDGTTTAIVDASFAVFTGRIPGDTVLVSTVGATVNYASKNVGTNITVTASGLTLGGADAGNYTLTGVPSLSGDIFPAPLTAAIIGNPTRVYNGTTAVTIGQSNYTLTGFAPGESATIFQLSGIAYDSKNAGARTITANMAPSDYTAGPNTFLSNYILPTTATGAGTITPAPITLQIIGNPTKAYDGNATATLTSTNYATDGFIAGEGATVTQTVGTYSSADAGTRTVTASIGLGDLAPDSGTLLSNYIFPTTVSGIGTITRVVVGGNVVDASIINNPTKVYDGTTVATLDPSNYSLTGFVVGEGATVTETVGEYSEANAGLWAVTALLDTGDFVANPGTNLNNYTLPTEATGIGTITRAPLSAAIIGNPTKVYNGTTRSVLTSANFDFTGFVTGEGATVSPLAGAYDNDDAGARTVTATLPTGSVIANSGTLLANYIAPTTASGPGTITPAPLVITNATAQSRVYDTTTVASLNLAGAAVFGVIATDAITLDTSGATAVFDDKNVGTGKTVTASGFGLIGAGQSNYTLFQPTGLTADITPKGLSVLNVTAQNKIYDNTTAATLNHAAAALSGVLGVDVVTLDDSSVSGTFNQTHAGNGLAVTASGFTIAGTDAGNYSLGQPGGLIANIDRAPLTATIIGNPTKTYDGGTAVTLGPANYALSGFVAGQGASVPQSAGAQYDLADAGARTITSTLVSSDIVANSGTDLSNYVLPTAGTGAGTINKANLIIGIIGNPTKVYDNTTIANLTSANYQLAGFVAGQGASVTETVGAYDTDNAGARTVTAALTAGDYTGTGSTNLANYTLPTTASGAGTITQATVSVIDVVANDKVYDGTTAATLDSSAADLTGVFVGDAVTVNSAAATGVFATKNVGANIAVAATGYALGGADAGNYLVVQPTGLFADITQATIALASVTKVYDAGVGVPGSDAAYTLSGVFGGDVVSVDASGVSGSYASKNVATGINVNLAGVALTGVDAPNYLIAPTATNAPIGIITPASLTVIGALANDKVYDRTVTATLDNSGAALSGVLATDDVVLSTAGSTGAFGDFNVGLNKPVTTSGYSVSGTDATNYAFIQPTGLTADITPLQITLTSVVKTYSGDTALPTDSAAYGFTGVISGDTVSAVTSGASGAYADKNVAGVLAGGVVTGGINVTLTGLSLTGSGAGNYTIAPVAAQPIGVIDRKLLTASIVGAPTRVYDATTAITLASGNYAIAGFVTGEGATVTETAGVYDSPNAGPRTVTATLDGSDFTATGATLLTNYTLPTTAGGAGQITPAPLTIAGVLATDKVYDGNTNDPLDVASAALVGVVPGDTINLLTGGAIGTFASPDVGANIAVSATGFAIGNDPNGNYTLSQPTGLFADITAALLSITKVTRVYTAGVDLPTVSSAYTLGGIVSGDDVSLDAGGISGFYADKNVGAGITVFATGYGLAGANAGNYSISPVLNNAPIGEITPATVGLTGMLANAKAYDGTTTLTLNNTGTIVVGRLGADDLDVDSAASTASFTSPNAGTYSVAASGYALIGVDAGNYILTQPSGVSATINPALLAASIIGTPTKTYDGATASVLASANYALTGFVGGEGATVTETAGTYASANAGGRLVTATLDSSDFTATGGALLSNYVLPTTATGLGLINQATLTAAVTGTPTKVYNGTTAASLTSANYTLTGFVTGEGATVTETVGTYALANVGARAVTVALDGSDFTAIGATLLANYVLPTTATGVGQIDQATLTAAIVGTPTKTYDGTTTATLAFGNYILSGFAAGEGASVTETAGVYGSANAGARTITATLDGSDFTATGATLLSNYILPTTASGAGRIDQALLTAAVIGTPTKTYDGTPLATLTSGDYTVSGFVAGEGASITETVGAYASANAGSRVVNVSLDGSDFTATGATLLSNYVLPTTAIGAGQIDQKSLTALLGGVAKTYDGNATATLASGDYTLIGFVAGEGATVTETAGTYASPNSGPRVVTATLDASDFTATGATLLSNYLLPTTATGAGQINQATLGVSIIGTPTKTYDGTTASVLASANYALTGFAAGEGASITETIGVYASANAGSRLVTASLDGSDFTAAGATLLSNYVLPTTASGAGLINQASLTAAIIGTPTKTYDGTNAAVLTAGSYSLTGFVAGEGASVTKTAGTYASANAGPRLVTADLDGSDFTANGGTLLSNYVLPTTASGAGQINQAALTALLSGVAKTYDGTTAATLAAGNYTLIGFVNGEGASVGETVGTYGSANAGPRLVTTTLDGSDFTASGATLLSNYVLPTTASGTGRINQASLAAAIIGAPTKTYDGNATASLTSANYSLIGFVTGEGAGVTQTTGTYASPNAGARIVTADLDSTDFTATGGTLLSNYVLPTTAVGLGQIDQKALAVVFNNVFKAYDGTTTANLSTANYALIGFVTGEGASITQATGTYASPNAGPRLVTATLTPSDFAADSGTLLSNYVLPASALGAGRIDPAALTAILSGVSKTYDGNAAATLVASNYSLVGFVAGEGADVTETVGTYGSPNAGPRPVAANLDASDFTATGATLLSNYVLPVTATGTGQIDPKTLLATITGSPTKTYDGATTARLTATDYSLVGFVAGEGAGVTQTVGAYDSPNAGLHGVTASLGAADFSAEAGTLLSNYALPTTAVGMGRIDQASLVALLNGVTKTYDGTTAAVLTNANYTLVGFAGGEGASVGETVGTYDSANAGPRLVTANLDSADFTASGATLLSNYVLPTTASGTGRIDQAALTAIINGASKTYDGTTAADLTSTNYTLIGFIAGEGGGVTKTVGTYASPNAGARIVTADLDSTDFTATGGTLLSNYVLPTTAVGLGQIDQKALAVVFNNVFKTYDGTTAANLSTANYALIGFVAGEGAEITETAGVYDSANAGARTVTASLGSGDFVAVGGTMLTNYVLPVTAIGAGRIDQAVLAAAIVGAPTRVYDGTTSAALTSANYALTGFVAGEGASITQTTGVYDSANAGARIVTADLVDSDFAADGATLLSNYVLPTMATGAGRIDRATLTAAIVGNPTKPHDGNTDAALVSANYVLTGFVTGEGASVTQTRGLYDLPDVGPRTVTASLDASDFVAGGGTLLSNYDLPTTASGPGAINSVTTNPPCVFARDGDCGPGDIGTFQRFGYLIGAPRFYVPFPGLNTPYVGHTAGFGRLPNVMRPRGQAAEIASADDILIDSGEAVINSTEQILLQGDKGKTWRIAFTPRPMSIDIQVQP